jgi:hypothetical protein
MIPSDSRSSRLSESIFEEIPLARSFSALNPIGPSVTR